MQRYLPILGTIIEIYSCFLVMGSLFIWMVVVRGVFLICFVYGVMLELIDIWLDFTYLTDINRIAIY